MISGPFRSISLHKFKNPISYNIAIELQNELVRRCRQDHTNHLILLQHQPVYTAGRRSAGFAALHGEKLQSLTGAKSIDSDRGGQVTWHGPGQLILYPIMHLLQYQANLHWYVNCLQKVMIRTCCGLGIEKVASHDTIGIWVNGDRKIGFIGFKNTGWITSHGLALNICPDLSFFSHIIPCGDPSLKVTSIAHELAIFPTQYSDLISKAELTLLDAFQNVFACQLRVASEN